MSFVKCIQLKNTSFINIGVYGQIFSAETQNTSGYRLFFSVWSKQHITLNTESLLGHVAKTDVMTSGSPGVKLAFKVKVVDMETEVTKIGEC